MSIFGAPKPPMKRPPTTTETMTDRYTRAGLIAPKFMTPTPYADLLSGFSPEQERALEEERERVQRLAEKTKKDAEGESIRTYGEQIAVRMNEMLKDAWSRRVMPRRAPADLIRKALNVDACAFGKDGGSIETLQGVREFIPKEFSTMITQDVAEDDLTAKALPRTTERIALLARALLENKENLRVAKLFDACCEKTGQTVAAHSLSPSKFFEAMSMVERTGAAVSFITVHRDDAEDFLCDLEGFRQENDRIRRGLGFVGKFDGIDIITPTSVVDNVVKRGCAYVTVVPEVIGALEEKTDYHFVPYAQLIEPEEGVKRQLGWTISGDHRLFATNPYGVARIDFGKVSERRI